MLDSYTCKFWLPEKPYSTLIQSTSSLLQGSALPCRPLPPSWHRNCIIQRSLHCSVKPAASGWWEHGRTSEFHEHGLTAVLIRLCSEFLYRKQCRADYLSLSKIFNECSDGSPGGSIVSGKANLYPNKYSNKDRALPSPQWTQSKVFHYREVTGRRLQG